MFYDSLKKINSLQDTTSLSQHILMTLSTKIHIVYVHLHKTFTSQQIWHTLIIYK